MSTLPSPHGSSFSKLLAWLHARKAGRQLTLLLALGAVLTSIVTYIAIARSPSPFGPDLQHVLGLILLNLLLLIALLAVVARRAVGLWVALRKGTAGAKLQTRIIVMFSLVTIIPTILVSVFSVLFFNFGIQSWFDTRVSTGLEESVAVAEAYLTEHKENLRADAIAMANDLGREMPIALNNPQQFSQTVSTQVLLRNLTEAVIFQRNRIIVRTRLSFSLAFEQLPDGVLERADNGEVVMITDEDNDKVRAIIKLGSGADTYLLIGRLVDSKVIAHMENTQGAVSEYQRLKQQISTLQMQFSFVFVLVTLLLLLSAVWYGLTFAGRLMTPVNKLISAAERVRAGDFTARVQGPMKEDEIGTLSRAFNRMTSQLETQRQELVEANRKLDERSRFMEAVLGGVSAGVIALNRNKVVSLHNRSAAPLLMLPAELAIEGKAFSEIFPEAGSLVHEAEGRPDTLAQSQIIHTAGEVTRTFNVKVTVEQFDDRIEGFIVTFDDISELVSAQRRAAWSDVARRVAHEIKNPLTPIQLAAERLKKKYLKQIEPESEKESFIKYTDTISKHVSDVGKIVEEFVSFARMPAPVFRTEDMAAIIKKIVFSEQVAHPDIQYQLNIAAASPLAVVCDEAQISQVFTNLLKNAAEAIEVTDTKTTGVQERDPTLSARSAASLREQEMGAGSVHKIPCQITITALARDGRCVIEIRDNGPGFPPDLLPKATEPYVTTRAKGTGLGLAIVKKTLEDHKASLTLGNHNEGGACISISFALAIDNYKKAV